MGLPFQQGKDLENKQMQSYKGHETGGKKQIDEPVVRAGPLWH